MNIKVCVGVYLCGCLLTSSCNICEHMRFMKNQYQIALILMQIHTHAHKYIHIVVSAFTLPSINMQQPLFFVYIATTAVGKLKTYIV